ncbi:SRPBCC family protein [Aeromicrobium marinum]|nr:SRPBCC family protein [Aeromicrobium marinum]
MATSHSIELTQATTAPPAAVWDVITDLDAAPDVLSGVDRVERIEGPGYAVGTRWRETRTMMGKSASEEMVVTAVEPTSRTVVEADGGGVHYRSEFELVPDGSGTTIVFRFSGEQVGTPSVVQRLVWRAFGGLGLKLTSKVMRTDLADIAAAAEARTV